MNIGKEKEYLDNAKKLKSLQDKRLILKDFHKGYYLSSQNSTEIRIKTRHDYVSFSETHSAIIRKLLEALIRVEIEDNEKAITEITQ